MALVYEWKIEDISAADGDPISSWTDDVNSVAVTNTSTARPTYKTSITPSGKPVSRFDGSDDRLVGSLPGTHNIRQGFVVAKWRSADYLGSNATLLSIFIPGVSDGIWFTGDGNNLSTSFGAISLTNFRDGSATNAIDHDVFHIYEFQFASDQTGPTTFAMAGYSSGGLFLGPWDIAYVGLHDSLVTGGTYTSLLAALTSTYITPAPPDITTTSLPDGTVGVSYSETIGVTGGTAPITFSVLSGSLPGGLSLDTSTGEISGTPTTAGSYSFTIRATDDAAATDDQALSIDVSPGPPDITTTSLPDGHVGDAYSETISLTGGVGSITWSVLSGSLPAGLSLDTSTGEISGTPTTVGTSSFTIRATDTTPDHDDQAFSIDVTVPPIIYEELDLTGLDVDSGVWAGQIIRKSFGGGFKRKVLVGPSFLIPRWKLSSGAWPGDEAYGNLINGMTRFDYYTDFFQRFTTGEDDVFVIDFHGKKWTVRFAVTELPFNMHSYDLFDSADGVEVEYAFVPGQIYNADGSLPAPDVPDGALVLGGDPLVLGGDFLVL